MRALLLAAGYGTRLRPITDRTPKCLVEIKGKPLLQYWFELLSKSKIDTVLINTHYLSEKVTKFIETADVNFLVETVFEESLLGTGGTILKNKHFFSGGAFMVAHADNLTLFDVDSFIEAHAARQAGIEITMMTFLTDVPESCGIVEVDPVGKVTAFHEKVNNPPGNQANAAVYIFEPSIIQFLETRKDKRIIDLSTEVIPEFMGRIQVFQNTHYHRDIGSPESLAIANKEFKDKD